MQNTTTHIKNFYSGSNLNLDLKSNDHFSTEQNSSFNNQSGQLQYINGATPPFIQNQNTNGSSKKTLGKLKKLFAVAGLVLFFIVAVMGIMISQKQVQQKGEDSITFAPNAPESKPNASSWEPNQCVTTFIVSQPFAECETKLALTDFASAGGTNIPAGSKFNIGDEFVFSLMVKNNSLGSVSNVKLIDTLPGTLSFVSGPTNPPYSVNANGQIVTAIIPVIEPQTTKKVEFKVKVTGSDNTIQTNTARVENNNPGGVEKQCMYDFLPVNGVVQCLSKNLYTSQGNLVNVGSALTVGKRYEYRVTAKATNLSPGDVKVYDVLPQGLKYIGPAAGSAGYITNDPNSGILTANFGSMKDETKTLGFIVEVPENINTGQIINKALVYSMPKNTIHPGIMQPEPPSDADECSVYHTILPTGVAECEAKEAYTDFDGIKIKPNTEINPKDEFIYKITVSAKATTIGHVVITDVLPKDLIFIQDQQNTAGLTYNTNNRTVNIDLGVMQTNEVKVVQFKVQLVSNPETTRFNNIAVVSTKGSSDEINHKCEFSIRVKQKTYSCNSECNTNEECTTIGKDYICYTTHDGNFCRLANNPSNLNCTYSTPTPTATSIVTPQPTPVLGCNELCTKNSDCTNAQHICLTTNDGSMRCRLADYPSASNCTLPTTTQPELPQVLPQTGPTHWINWLKAGLVTLGIGTALFLLL